MRIAFKAFEMGILFDFVTGGDPTSGTLANSQKQKIDAIDAVQMWQHNPFVHYNVKKKRDYFELQKKNKRVKM